MDTFQFDPDPRSWIRPEKMYPYQGQNCSLRANRFFVVDILPLGFGSGVTDPDESNIYIIV